MALSNSFSPADQIVHVACEGDDRTFQIHRKLLVDNAPDLPLHWNHTAETWSAHADASYDALEYFARWLYNGIIPELGTQSFRFDTNVELMAAHALGRAVGCVNFMDAIFDAIVDGMTHHWTYCPKDILNRFSDNCPAMSGGWRFAVDYVLYFDEKSCSSLGCDTYEDMVDVTDNRFLTELARKIMVRRGFQVTEDVEKPDFCRLIITGYLESRAMEWLVRTGEPAEEDYPWTKDKCQYHRHTELGLPCYNTEESDTDSS